MLQIDRLTVVGQRDLVACYRFTGYRSYLFVIDVFAYGDYYDLNSGIFSSLGSSYGLLIIGRRCVDDDNS